MFTPSRTIVEVHEISQLVRNDEGEHDEGEHLVSLVVGMLAA